jgi:hypothetical protein
MRFERKRGQNEKTKVLYNSKKHIIFIAFFY